MTKGDKTNWGERRGWDMGDATKGMRRRGVGQEYEMTGGVVTRG